MNKRTSIIKRLERLADLDRRIAKIRAEGSKIVEEIYAIEVRDSRPIGEILKQFGYPEPKNAEDRDLATGTRGAATQNQTQRGRSKDHSRVDHMNQGNVYRSLDRAQFADAARKRRSRQPKETIDMDIKNHLTENNPLISVIEDAHQRKDGGLDYKLIGDDCWYRGDPEESRFRGLSPRELIGKRVESFFDKDGEWEVRLQADQSSRSARMAAGDILPEALRSGFRL